MSQTLYRKYRPQHFRDIIGQEHIVTTLTNAIATNNVAHAYLFTGPRGTGKTSTARLFATAVNCTKRKGFVPAPQKTCEALKNGTAVDLIEIDAASHTGVDHIRDLRDTVALMPTSAPYKVYIIDEVHMLSTGAFNALLKTLEEPPEHVIFILATTEIHKVPETIISRTQRFDFARITTAHIIKKLQKIITAEKITCEPPVLEMIAIAAHGGMRDAESILAQVIAFSDNKITQKDVQDILGLAPIEFVHDLIEAFIDQDVHRALQAINAIAQKDYPLHTFLTSVIEGLRHVLFFTLSPTQNMTDYLDTTTAEKNYAKKCAQKTTSQDITAMIEQCIIAQNTHTENIVPQLPLEIAAVKICGHHNKIDHNSTNDSVQKPTQKKPTKKKDLQPTRKKHHNKSTATSTKKLTTKTWHKIIASISEENMSLASLLMQTIPKQKSDETLVLIVKYELHKDKILEHKNQLTIKKAFDTIIAMSITIRVDVVSEDDFLHQSPSKLLSHARNMMGGTLLETMESV